MPTDSTSFEESDINIGEGLAVERKPQGGRRGGKEGGQEGAQEGAGLVQVVWRNTLKNNSANENVDKDRKRYEEKHIISKLHCLRSGAVRLNKKEEIRTLRENTHTIKKSGKIRKEGYRQCLKKYRSYPSRFQKQFVHHHILGLFLLNVELEE